MWPNFVVKIPLCSNLELNKDSRVPVRVKGLTPLVVGSSTICGKWKDAREGIEFPFGGKTSSQLYMFFK